MTSPCKNCPDRRVGCHSTVCPKWMEFEEYKKEKYATKAKEEERIYLERKYREAACARMKKGRKKNYG